MKQRDQLLGNGLISICPPSISRQHVSLHPPCIFRDVDQSFFLLSFSRRNPSIRLPSVSERYLSMYLLCLFRDVDQNILLLSFSRRKLIYRSPIYLFEDVDVSIFLSSDSGRYSSHLFPIFLLCIVRRYTSLKPPDFEHKKLICISFIYCLETHTYESSSCLEYTWLCVSNPSWEDIHLHVSSVRTNMNHCKIMNTMY